MGASATRRGFSPGPLGMDPPSRGRAEPGPHQLGGPSMEWALGAHFLIGPGNR